MARIREYSREAVLQAATQLFWEKGYSATSVSDLVAATGLNKQSMYKEFGNKEGLFLACIENYVWKSNREPALLLEKQPLGFSNIEAFFGNRVEYLISDECKGCMLVNTAIEQEVLGDEINKRTLNYLAETEKAFLKCLQAAQQKGCWTDGQVSFVLHEGTQCDGKDEAGKENIGAVGGRGAGNGTAIGFYLPQKRTNILNGRSHKMKLVESIEEFNRKLKADLPEEVVDALVRGRAVLAEQGVGNDALRVEDAMPAFELEDATGKAVSSTALLAKGPLVISFYRGGWCPYCNLELRALQDILPEIEKHGGTLVAISPELPDNSLSTAEKNELSFPVLSDLNNEVARSFGLVFELPKEVEELSINTFDLDIRKLNGTEKSELPVPATFVVGRDGVVRYAFVDPDYTRRAEPEEILKALEQI
jgi:peroxiredoxin/AcrR family transcriptional regulator